MRRPFIFTSLGVVKGESKRGNRKCGPENTENKPGLRLVYKEEICQIAGLLFKIPHKMLSFVPTSHTL